MSRDVFISYKTEDREAAERLCSALERQDISCWLAPRDIPPGREWAAAIVEGLQRSKNFVVLLSGHSAAAKQIAREAELADHQDLPILTFRLEDVQPPKELLYFLGNIQWLDGFGGQFDSAAARLVEVIRSGAAYPAPKTAMHAPPAFDSIPIATPIATPSAPVAPLTSETTAAVAPLPNETTRKPYLIPLAAGILALIGLGVWFGLRKSSEPAASDGKAVTSEVQEAKDTADRFLEERDSGKYAAAWNEYANGFRNKINETTWQDETAKRNRVHGGISEHQYQDCRSEQPDVYICRYTLLFKDGSRFKNQLRVEKNEAGRWLIDNGAITEER